MAQRYLDMNPDLQHAYGRGSSAAKQMARQHYTDYGATEGRSIVVPTWDEIWYCGDTGTKSEFRTQSTRCGCDGTLHYGFRDAPDTNKTIETLDEMRFWKTHTVQSKASEWTDCNDLTFGIGSTDASNVNMQCICEPKK